MAYEGPVRQTKLTSLDHPDARYHGFHPGETETLKAGYTHHRGHLPLPCDIIRERDVTLVMRDGTKIYADVFRPVTDESVPAIMHWAPYGKGQTGPWDLRNKDMFPNHFGVPRSSVSGLQSWEACDPAHWCAQGYAVVQVDARGAFDSEGHITFQGPTEGLDGHDAIEEIAAMDWCSGKVGMAGNSWLALSQWRIAAEQPAHLAAIAPWEGLTDLYRDALVRGGIPYPPFVELIRDSSYGRGMVEDPVAMLEDHPLFDEYWADKLPDLTKINVPAYVVASYANPIHVPGTLHNWRALPGAKWLRVHNTHEWPDFYSSESTRDLRRFFDRYLRDLENGWEATPAVRIAVLDPGHTDTINRVEDNFPPSRMTSTVLHLDAQTHALQHEPPTAAATTGYDIASKEPRVDFTYTFDSDVEVIGRPIASLWVAALGHDDADIYLHVEKLDSRGRQQWHQAVDLGFPAGRRWMPLLHRAGVKMVQSAFYAGPSGMLRASRRGLDPDRPDHDPELLLTSESKLSDGQPVQIEIPLWQVAMRWHAGETLRLRISARSLLPAVLPGLAEDPLQPGTRHEFHTGPDHPATLVLPTTPAI